jgi:hypothetical protein
MSHLPRYAILLLLLAGSAVPAAAAPHRPTQSVVGAWIVTWLGIPVIRGRFRSQVSGGRYEAWFGAKSFGAFDALLKIKMNWYVRGRVDGDRFRPVIFRQNYRDHREKRRTVMKWRPDGSVRTRLIPPESPGKRKKVPARLQRHTVDPMSALLALTAQATGRHPCRYKARIFEGRRRVDARLRLIEKSRTPEGFAVARNLPKAAWRCHLFADRLAGFRPRHMRRFPGKLPPADIWLVRLSRHRLWAPVRIEFGTRFGRVRAFMTDIKVTSR